MKKHLVVGENKEKGYTLLIRLDPAGRLVDPTPYVVAWCYSDKTDDWLAGHYFDNIEQAVAFLHHQ